MQSKTKDTVIRHLKGIVAALENKEKKAPLEGLRYLAARCNCGEGLMITYEKGNLFDFTCAKCESRTVGFIGETPDIALKGLKQRCKML